MNRDTWILARGLYLVLIAVLVVGPTVELASIVRAPKVTVGEAVPGSPGVDALDLIAHAPKVTVGDASGDELAPPTAEARLQTAFGNLPLYFIENRGQVDKRVAYYVQGSDATLYFTSGGVTFALTGGRPTALTPRPPSLVGKGEKDTLPRFGEGLGEGLVSRYTVKLDFLNANPAARPIAQDQTPAVVSYFKGPRDQWQTGLPTYSTVVYADVWPGIDLIYSGTVNQLKYRFVVHPGADPHQIRLAYRGATNLTVNNSGQLVVTTPARSFTDDAPVAYQEIGGERVEVQMAYQLATDGLRHN